MPLSNMSFAKYKDNYLLSIRKFNYILTQDKQQDKLIGTFFNTSFKTNKDTFYYNRGNYFILVDKHFNFIKQYRHVFIEDTIKDEMVEDIRLVNWNNKLYCSGTFVAFNIQDSINCSINAYSLDIDDVNDIIFLKQQMSSLSLFRSTQKNWIAIENKPFMYISQIANNSLQLIDMKNRIAANIKQSKKIGTRKTYSGSANIIRFNKKQQLCLVHYHIDQEYISQFILLDNELNFLKMSEPFKFTYSKIEFIQTMMLSTKNSLLFTVSKNDMLSYLFEIDKKTIMKLF